MTEYYVSTSGNDANIGSSNLTAWQTITYSATQAQAGDTVYIKGGNYGHEHVVICNSGTSGNPIIFQGYDDEVIMNGADDTGYGLHMNSKSYIIISGFNISDYLVGVLGQCSHHVTVNDCVVYSNHHGIEFSGTGGHNHTIQNIKAYNNDMHNIALRRCADSLIEDCWSYNREGLGTYADYAYVIYDNSSHNIIRNCVAGQYAICGGHGMGHGFAFRHNSSHNQIIKCRSYNTGCEHYKTSEDSDYNEFINCSGEGEDIGRNTWAFNIKSSNNILRGCVAQDMDVGIKIYSSVAEPSVHPLQGNIFENCVVTNNTDGIQISNLGSPPPDNNTIKNCIVVNNTNKGIYVLSGVTNTIIKYNDVWNNTNNYVGCSAGVGDINIDPLFADYVNNNFHLKSQYGRWDDTGWVYDGVTSPCIDAGDPSDDYINEPTPNGKRINIGIYGNTIEASLSEPEYIIPTVTNIVFSPDEIKDNMKWSAIVTITNENNYDVENITICFYYSETPESIFYITENITIPALSSINIETIFEALSAGQYNMCSKVIGEQ